MPKQCAKCKIIKYCKAVEEIRMVNISPYEDNKMLPLCKECTEEEFEYWNDMRKDYEASVLLKANKNRDIFLFDFKPQFVKEPADMKNCLQHMQKIIQETGVKVTFPKEPVTNIIGKYTADLEYYKQQIYTNIAIPKGYLKDED